MDGLTNTESTALTATPAGRAVFGRLGFEPTGYEEVFVAGADTTEQDGGKARMVCIYPAGSRTPDEIESGGLVINRSEMVVTHSGRRFWDAGAI